MLVWLNGNQNTVRSPNENFGRELMELFTLGASRGYGEQDVRQQARALTGWQGNVVKKVASTFAFNPKRHDDGVKTIFGQSGTFDWQDSCRLCLENANHPSFFVAKLWRYFVPTAAPPATASLLERLYVSSGYQVGPVVRRILLHPDLYNGPRMVKPPVVYTAGLLRARGRGIDTAAWTKLDDASGQRLFLPPNVAGWDESRWLDTATFRGRWFVALTALDPSNNLLQGKGGRDAEALVREALAYWSSPSITKKTHAILVAFARKHAASDAVDIALRQLVATSPDLQAA